MADFTVEPELPARLDQMAQMFADHGHTELAATVTHANEAVAALATEVDRLREALDAAELFHLNAVDRWRECEAALRPFAEFASAGSFDLCPDDVPMTKGSRFACRQVTAGDFRAARAALAPKGGA